MPLPDYMEKVQKDANANANMRAVLVDWLVEITEEYKLLPYSLHLSVCYIDKYLSINVVNKQKLQLLGVASMFIASKYEEITPPNVDELCDIAENGTKNKTLGLSKISQTPNISSLQNLLLWPLLCAHFFCLPPFLLLQALYSSTTRKPIILSMPTCL